MSSEQTKGLDDVVAIHIDDVSKIFQIYSEPHHRLLQGIFRGRKQFFKEFCALRGISFDVNKGEVVGIIGRNGSGKSTLLQIICGTMRQSTGIVEVKGRIAALLELGTGFNPEFTGRENVYINGAILGLTRSEIDARFESITDFAEIGDFIEQPIKTYSSGMYVRLAFAIAINVDPEILVVDEALSVGDERFQRKCFARIENIRKQGATILFVSHAANTIVELCDRAVLIDRGEVLAIGMPKKIVGYYQKLLYAPDDKSDAIREQIRLRPDLDSEFTDATEPASQQRQVDANLPQDNRIEMFDPNLNPSSTIEYEQLGAQIESPMILTLDGLQVNNLIRGRTYRYIYTVQFTEDASSVRFAMAIQSISGVALGGSVSAASLAQGMPFVESGTAIRAEFKFNCLLNPGVYFLNSGVLADRDGSETYLHRCLDLAMFRVLPEIDSLPTILIDFGCVPRVEIIGNHG